MAVRIEAECSVLSKDLLASKRNPRQQVTVELEREPRFGVKGACRYFSCSAVRDPPCKIITVTYDGVPKPGGRQDTVVTIEPVINKRRTQG